MEDEKAARHFNVKPVSSTSPRLSPPRSPSEEHQALSL